MNTSPTHAYHRYVINFRDYPVRRVDLDERWVGADEDQCRQWLRRGVVPLDYPAPVAEDWPELLKIVEEKVKPDRAGLTKNPIGRKRAAFWWQYGSLAKELYRAISGMKRVLVCAIISNKVYFAFLPTRRVFSHKLVVFPLQSFSAFCALQSNVHETWARFFSSTMKDDINYSSSDCFETFPFPKSWTTHSALETAGKAYYDFRANLMVRNDQGLTKTYNRFHDPNEDDPDIAKLRELHAAMDRVVLDAYGWNDIPTDCEFLLDYEINEEEWTKRKKPYRYRWPDDIRDGVLARLLELNAQRPKREAGTKPAYWANHDDE